MHKELIKLTHEVTTNSYYLTHQMNDLEAIKDTLNWLQDDVESFIENEHSASSARSSMQQMQKQLKVANLALAALEREMVHNAKQLDENSNALYSQMNK